MLDTVIPLFPGIPGGPEVLIVLFVLVLLFGANKIPKLARSTGQAMGEFQKGRQEIEEELEEMQDGDAPASGEPTGTPAAESQSATSDVESGSEADETEREAN